MVGNRKWKVALWGLCLGTTISAVSVVGWWCEKPGAAGILAQGGGLVTLSIGIYASANVAQKSVTRSPDAPVLGGKNGGKNE